MVHDHSATIPLSARLDLIENRSIDDHGHRVQFYESDSFLLESVRDFISAGFERGEAALIVATEERRMAIDELLEATDVDLQELRSVGRYVLLDANESSSRFMVDGEPEASLFAAAIGSRVAQAAEAGSGVRIFGEMVALLWDKGNVAAALRLEELWNDLARIRPFSLLCAYPMSGFTEAGLFSQVCNRHARVIPTESYTALNPEERMRAITELQRQVTADGRDRQAQALELNDAIVQGLAAAKMALELGRYDVLEKTLAETLNRASEMASGLLEGPTSDVGPGDLRHASPPS